MAKPRGPFLCVGIILAMAIGTTLAGDPKKDQKDRVIAGEPVVKRLLLLMDADNNGKIAKQEFMQFMETEFDRLDKDKTGELDINALKPLTVRPIGHNR